MLIAKSASHSFEHLQFHSLDVDLHTVNGALPERFPELVEADDEDRLSRSATKGVIGHSTVSSHGEQSKVPRLAYGEGQDRHVGKPIQNTCLIHVACCC